MTDTIAAALAALKTNFQAINPAPEPVPAAVYAWPADRLTTAYDTYPFIIVARSPHRPSTVTAAAAWYHNWVAEVLICLMQGPLSKIEAAAIGEEKTLPWILAATRVLLADQGLGGTAINIGTGNQVFSYRDGHIGWDSRTFWGIRFEIPVRQGYNI